MSNPKPLSTERAPATPLPKDYVPPGGWPYKVKDKDDWHSVARMAQRRAETIIHFNFQTTDPAEVNWYLRVNVGCKVTDGPRWNWKFSSSADPGIIYIPPENMDFDTEVVRYKPPLKIDWAASLDYPPGGPHKTTLAFEIGHLVVVGLEMFGHVPIVLAVAAPFAAELAVLLAIGSAHQDAIASAMRKEMKNGYSLGVVLGANGAKPSYVMNNFVKHYPVLNAVYPEEGKNLQRAFNLSLESGYRTARKLNQPQVENLFRLLHSKMKGDLPTSAEDWKNWSALKKRRYYDDAAMTFKHTFIK